MGASVWAMKRTNIDGVKDSNVDKVVLMDQIDKLLQNCDYVCNVLPNTEKTTDCLSNGILEHCKGNFDRLQTYIIKILAICNKIVSGTWFSFKFIYSEKATKFCEISTVDLSYVVPVKSTLEILHNFVPFSECMNFTLLSKMNPHYFSSHH